MNMNTNTHINVKAWMLFLSLAVAFTGLFVPASARADELADLQSRFKARYPKLQELRNSGAVGETWDGWVQVVKGTGEKEVAEIVVAENVDRKALYVLLAARQKTTPELVGERNGLRIFKSAAPDHYLKTKDGKWDQKKNIKIEG